MQEKFEFDKLLPELTPVIAQNSKTPVLINFASTSKHYSQLFKPLINIHKFLYYVVRRNDNVVKAMLKTNVNLLTEKGTVTDLSGRTFFDISAFEYALWALDKHLWMMMLKQAHKTEQPQTIMKKLLVQYGDIKARGVCYELNDKFVRESHFDFQNTIIKELGAQTNFFKPCKKVNWFKANQHWQKGVGGAQRLLPVHVILEYCSTTLFYPLPKFIDPPTIPEKIYNLISNWYHSDSKLGVDFAILKGWEECVVEGDCDKRPARGFWYDLKAMRNLSLVRTKDFTGLEVQIEEFILSGTGRDRPQNGF